MLKLNSIRLRNWCKTEHAFIEFPDRGFVFMRGINKSATDERSNGAGKSALGEAINRTLLGQSFRTALASYSRDRKGDTYVDVHAQFRGQPLRVELGYKCAEFPTSRGEGLRYTIGDQSPVERPEVSLTRAELTEMLGVTPDVSLWTVFLDGERLKFNPPFLSQTDALSLLMQALNQPPWEKFKAQAEQRRTTCHEARTRAHARLQQLRSTSLDFGRLVEHAEQRHREETVRFEAAHTMWTREHDTHAQKVHAVATQITSLATTRDKLKKEIVAVQKTDAEACGKIDLEITRLGGERRLTEKYLQGWTDTVATDRSALHHAQADLKLLQEGKNCPTCHSPLKAGDPAAAIKEKTRIEKLATTLRDSTGGKEECETCLRAIDDELSLQHELRKKLHSAQLETLSRDLETAETRLSSASRQLHSLEVQPPKPPNEDAKNQTHTVLEERQQQQTAHTQELEAASSTLATADRALSQAAYWVKGFSAEGIPNLVLRQTVGPLNEAARIVSSALAGGLVKVSFSTETELASGMLKPKLVTEVDVLDGATDFLSNSKGEASLANLIIAETQTQVGRVLQRIGYRWFDEVANTLSGDARRCLYSGLKHQANELGLLTFVVDHHAEAANAADHVLLAEKSGGLTTYRWS